MFEKIIVFNTMFSQFCVALASQNESQIRFFTSFFENVDLVKILTKHWLCAEKSMFEKIIFFNTMFSQFFVALASPNGSQICFSTSFFENVDLVKILTKHWLCAEKSRFGF